MSDEYVQVLQDYETLRRDCSAFLQSYDGWIAEKKDSILNVKAAYQAKAAEQKEKHGELKSELDQLQNHMNGLRKAEERERIETMEMERMITELSQKYVSQVNLRGQLTTEIADLKKQIMVRSQTLEAAIARRENLARKVEPEIAFFESKMAMKIFSLKGEALRFSFTHINSKLWDEEYFFIVDVSQEVYKVLQCQPPIKDLDLLLNNLNRTRDFYLFLKDMRKAFQSRLFTSHVFQTLFEMLVESTQLWLRNTEFELTVSATLNKELEPAHLNVKLRRESPLAEWTGSFTDQYVEEIAKKTGNFKRFSIFIEMLFSAIRKSSPVVGLDILTNEDLDHLKRGEKQPFAGTSTNISGRKVYLILTYAVAFDRVHYPLPLSMTDEVQSNGSNVISSLRDEVNRLQSERLNHLEKISWLLKENDRLKHLLKHESQKMIDNTPLVVLFLIFLATTSINFALSVTKSTSSSTTASFLQPSLIDRLQSVLYEIEEARAHYKHTRNLSEPLKSLVDILADMVSHAKPSGSRGRVPRDRTQPKTRTGKVLAEDHGAYNRKPTSYKVIKSRPLVLESPEKLRTYSPSPARRSGSFQRFDPTL
ncbi:hypothetical protein HDU67_001279 [Dinochytrium kinnereticum]|nr:hypothetical protein HDU67_001279 [Dinochytrium kinnereticum]